MALRWMTVGLAAGLAFGVAIGDAAAQANQAQQLAYAKAYQGRWVSKTTGNEFEVRNDGKEVHFDIQTVSPQLANVGIKVNERIHGGTFDGPNYKGFFLQIMGNDDNARAQIRIKCGGTHKFWIEESGKMNFDRNEIQIALPAFILARNAQTNKCETFSSTNPRYEQAKRMEVLYTGQASNIVMFKKQR